MQASNFVMAFYTHRMHVYTLCELTGFYNIYLIEHIKHEKLRGVPTTGAPGVGAPLSLSVDF